MTTRHLIAATILTLMSSLPTAEADTFPFTFTDGQTLTLKVESASVTGILATDSTHYAPAVTNGTSRSLAKAEELIALNPITADGDRFILLIARYPSQRRRPEGYCGAGYEDYLLLLGATKRTLRILDKLLIQSCLRSISLDSDDSDDPRAGMRVDQHGSIHLEWLDHQDYPAGERVISVNAKRIVVK